MKVIAVFAALAIPACNPGKMPRPVTEWDDLPRPFIVGHRGSGNVAAPENTYAAFDAAAAAGAAIETDIQRTSDGGLVLMHDGNVAITTGQALGNISDLTLAQIATLDASQIFHPEIFSPQPVPSLDVFLERYGRTSLLSPEIKPAAGPTGSETATLIRQHGLETRVLGYSFFPDQLTAMRTVDAAIPLVLIDTEAIGIGTVESLDLWGVSVAAHAITSGYVASMHSARKVVLAWTVDTLTDAERLAGYGVDGLVTNDPGYLAKLLRRRTPAGTTTVSIPTGLLGSGWVAYSSTPAWAKAVVNGFGSFTGVSTVADTAYSHIHISGIRTADTPTTQTIVTTLRVQSGPTSGDVTRYVGLRFAWSTDNDTGLFGTTATKGYYVALRLNGTVELVRVVDGSPHVIANTTWPALQQGQLIPIRVDVDAARISVTRTDTSDVISAADAALPRGGFVSAFGSGVVPAVGETTVTY